MKAQRGFTLVELVMAIMIIGIAAAALFSAIGSILGRSADPMLKAQSLEIAESHLEEVLAHPLPAGFTAAGCPALVGTPNRENYADVCDYTRLNGTVGNVSDAFGYAIPGLGQYAVAVTVTAQALGPGALQTAAADSARVRVTVTDPTGATLQLDGYRTRP